MGMNAGRAGLSGGLQRVGQRSERGLNEATCRWYPGVTHAKRTCRGLRSTQPVLLHLIEQRGLGHPQFLARLTEIAAAALQSFSEQVLLEGFDGLGKAKALAGRRQP